jgi:hypothetical protein
MSGQLQAPAALAADKVLTAPIVEEAGWPSEPALTRTLWRKENLAPVGNRTLAVQLIALRYRDS